MTREKKFTPGKWEFGTCEGEWSINVDGDSLMCNTAYYPWNSDNIYDWHLIAASPLLLEALEDMCERCMYCNSMERCDNDHCPAKKAILKAYGETP
jgi:hypothetical protein